MGIKYQVNEKFFDKWSHEMAYILGFIYADGTIYRSARGNYIVITSTDKQIIYQIKKQLKSDHTIKKEEFNLPNRKPRFILRIGNKNLYNALIKIGLYPNKSLTIGMPRVPPKFIGHFTRGYFDGDGCINLYRSKGKTQRLIVRKLSVIFSSGSKKFLKDLLKILRDNVPLIQTKIYKGCRCFQLRHSTIDSIALFKFLYKNTDDCNKLFFYRKFNIFTKYFKLRPSKIDSNIKNIIFKIGHVVK